ncbi:serine hydrolase, partial [bacterium]|nr:serine hydrolase [bacterium]
PEQAAAGLWTNPTDLCRYIIETAMSYNGKSQKVLTPEFTKLRLEPVKDEAALGVFISRKDSSLYFSHGGANEGFTCYYVGDAANGNGMVIMTNSDNGSLCSEVANSVAAVYGWNGYYEPVMKTVIDTDPEFLAKFAGKYETGGEVFNMKVEDGKLLISPAPGYWTAAYFTSETDFFVREFEGDLKFVIDEKGKVTGFVINNTLIRKTN